MYIVSEMMTYIGLSAAYASYKLFSKRLLSNRLKLETILWNIIPRTLYLFGLLSRNTLGSYACLVL